MMKYGFVCLLAFCLGACASYEQTDRSVLNHRAMDLASSPTTKPSSYLTNLGDIQKTSSGGGCVVCAK